MVASSVFSNCSRTNAAYRRPTEPEFRYLDESARPEAFKARALVDEWFEHLQASERGEWLGRFRDDDAGAHNGAFFELLLHEWLLRLGYEVEPHPCVPGTMKRPDFRAVKKEDGTTFFLEARSANGTSPAELRSLRFVDQVILELMAIRSPDYFVFSDFYVQPEIQPRLSWFKKSVADWLSTLRYDAVRDAPEAHVLELEVGGGKVLLTPHVKGDTRGQLEIFGGLMVGDAQIVDTQSTIQSAIRRKQSRYGSIDAPYIIAVNDRSEFFHESHGLDSLFGMERVQYRGSASRPVLARDGSGLFGTADHPATTRVSGVLLVPGVSVWTFPRRVPMFYTHPWAKHKVGKLFGDCDGQYVDGDDYRPSSTSPNFAYMFGLDRRWPENIDLERIA